MFGIGIIGCGKIAQVRHIPEYADHPEAVLRGFYDINLDRAGELAEKYGGTAYDTVESLLANLLTQGSKAVSFFLSSTEVVTDAPEAAPAEQPDAESNPADAAAE